MSLWVYLTGEANHFDANITHNLARMADEAGIYKAIWRPEEVGVTHGRHLIGPLKRGIGQMLAEPERFERLNPSNGWGTYKDFLRWLESYLSACEAYPDATVEVSR